MLTEFDIQVALDCVTRPPKTSIIVASCPTFIKKIFVQIFAMVDSVLTL